VVLVVITCNGIYLFPGLHFALVVIIARDGGLRMRVYKSSTHYVFFCLHLYSYHHTFNLWYI